MKVDYELIISVVNRGFADDVMDAAKSAGAFGGTVLHARGTGAKEAEKFFGIIVQPEKDMVWILTEREKRSDIMRAIHAGIQMESAGKGMCFSLPVDSVTGLGQASPEELIAELSGNAAEANTLEEDAEINE